MLDQQQQQQQNEHSQQARSSLTSLQTTLSEREGVVRAYMITVLAHWKPSEPRHVECALQLLDRLFSTKHVVLSAHGVFDNSIEHRRKVLVPTHPFIFFLMK